MTAFTECLPVFPIEQPAARRSRQNQSKNCIAADGVNAVSNTLKRAFSLDYRKIIKEIGRGKNHARDLDSGIPRAVCIPEC